MYLTCFRCKYNALRQEGGGRVNQMRWDWSLVGLAALCGATLISTANAGEDARVLPKGIGRMNFIFAQTTGISQTFDEGGHIESITAPYNLDLSGGNIAALAPQLNTLINDLDQLMPGVHYNASERDNGHYGLTDNPNDQTLGAALTRGFLSIGAEDRKS